MYFAPPTVAVILVVDSNIVTTVVQVECISKGSTALTDAIESTENNESTETHSIRNQKRSTL